MTAPLVQEYRRICDDPASHQPLAYLRLRQAMRAVIEQRALEPGQALPSERELAHSLALSRVTVRKAIAGLVEDGLLDQRHGAGTFVTERIIKPVARLSSFTEDLRERGLTPHSRFLQRGCGEATPDEAMALNLSPGEPVARLYRLRCDGDTPLAIERTVVPSRYLPDPDRVSDSLYQALAQQQARPHRALQHLRAVALDASQAELLQMAAGSPCLRVERRSFLKDGQVVEFTRSWYRSDMYDFVAELHTDG